MYGYGFLSRALPISVKFCMAVRPHLRQVFSYLGGIAPGMAELWASTGAIWRDMLLAEAPVVFFFFLLHIEHQSSSPRDVATQFARFESSGLQHLAFLSREEGCAIT